MPNIRKYFVGDHYFVKDGEFVIEELDKKTYRHATIRWILTGNTQRIRLDTIHAGSIRNPMAPCVEGVGFVGVGEYLPSDIERHNSWTGMLRRCYSSKHLSKYPSYEGCKVAEEWHNFQIYSQFYEEDTYRQKGWHLDKDLIVLGNKVYSPETCLYIPPEINVAGISLQETKTPHGYKGVSRCARSGKWMSVVWSKDAKSNKTTGGRHLDIRHAAAEHIQGEICKFTYLAEKYERLIDPRGTEALYERVRILIKKKEDVLS